MEGEQTVAIVGRVGRPFAIEAVRMLEAGEGTVQAIDAALTAAGYREAPFRRLDEIWRPVPRGDGAVADGHSVSRPAPAVAK